MPKTAIVYFSPDSLRANPKNSRVHPTEQVRQVKKSIEQFGFTIPVLVNEGNVIIAGHCRTQAAQELSLSEIPCIVAKGWTETQQRAYTIADNKLTENGEWDNTILRSEFEFLRETDESFMGLLGFANDEIAVVLEDDQYAPVLDPQTGNSSVTQNDIDRELQRQEGQFDGEQRTLIPLTCPNCGHDFQID